MKRKNVWTSILYLVLALLLAIPFGAVAEQSEGDSTKKLTQEQLAQLLAPIALYPDDLVTQILMASTYPLEVVQADRWAKSHKQSAGDVLAKQLEKEPWDPSVKSLVNFPTVLAAMSEKLDVTTKIGDAFLSQQKDVMDTIQVLRKKAQAAGNLKTTKEQKVIVEKEVIIIQPADPQVDLRSFLQHDGGLRHLDVSRLPPLLLLSTPTSGLPGISLCGRSSSRRRLGVCMGTFGLARWRY